MREIEASDYPIRSKNSHNRIKYINELVELKLASVSLSPKNKPYFTITDTGKLAVNIILGMVKETIRLHPSSTDQTQSRRKRNVLVTHL